MKNMFDRHIVLKKKINRVFQHYPESVLPNLVENCDGMNQNI